MADCTLCGCRWINGYMGCSRAGCNEYRLVTECNEWPVSLGLAIRRFVRACEVRDLHAIVATAVPADHAPMTRDALDRLAALAMEVEP